MKLLKSPKSFRDSNGKTLQLNLLRSKLDKQRLNLKVFLRDFYSPVIASSLSIEKVFGAFNSNFGQLEQLLGIERSSWRGSAAVKFETELEHAQVDRTFKTKNVNKNIKFGDIERNGQKDTDSVHFALEELKLIWQGVLLAIRPFSLVSSLRSIASMYSGEFVRLKQWEDKNSFHTTLD